MEYCSGQTDSILRVSRLLPIYAWLVPLGLLGCQDAESRRCQLAFAANDYEVSARVCDEAYRRDRSPKTGFAAARSAFALGQDDLVLDWRKRLAGTEVEADVWTLVGRVHARGNRYGPAHAAFARALAFYRKRGDHRGEGRTSYLLFYHLHWPRSQYREALESAVQALSSGIAAGDRELRQMSSEALFTVLSEIGDLKGASRTLDSVAELMRLGDVDARLRFLLSRGHLRLEERRPNLARGDLEEALRLAGSHAERGFLRGAHVNLAQTFLDLGRRKQAELHLQLARDNQEPAGSPEPSVQLYTAKLLQMQGDLPGAREVLEDGLARQPAADWAWDLELLLGRVAELQLAPAEAEAAYQRSAAIVEEMRSSLPTGDLRTDLLDRKREPLVALFSLRARQARALAALEAAERIRARTLLDALVKSTTWPRTNPNQPESYLATSRHLTDLESLISTTASGPTATLEPIAEVLEAFGNRHGLVYVEAGEVLWLLVVAKGKVDLHRIGLPATEVRGLASRFQQNVTSTELAARLGQTLLPSGSLPAPGEVLYVVTEGILSQVPFSVLRLEDRFVVEDWPLVLVPSLNALVALEQRRLPESRSAAVLGDARNDLPGAAAEAREVSKLLATTPHLGAEATAGRLFRASGSRVLHLAAHSGNDSRGGWIQLADRDVTAPEIVRARLGPPLVVLASCASGARSRSEVWGSLDAAFLAAGSRSVLSSLWAVEDSLARDFVLSFYRRGGASDPAVALAQAQRVAIRQGVSPTVWAPFVLMGSARPLDEPWEEGDDHEVARRGISVQPRAR